MPCVVLVTGGSGYVGRHVVGLLQAHAPHVTEIRIIDLNPYENKLDYESSKPVQQYIGSITDRELVRQACEGVSSVLHIASLIDVSMFPNDEKLNTVNVTGTAVLLDVCREMGVKRFIYCSSMSAVAGPFHYLDVTEDSLQIPDKLLIAEYGSSKLKAETMVLKSNCDNFRTVALRPSAIYGEEDELFITKILELSRKTGSYTLMDCGKVTQQMAYVGNVAWMFICADKSLLADDSNEIGGNAFFIADDTPCDDVFEMRVPFVNACNYPRARYKLPWRLVMCLVYIAYFILSILSPFWKVNFPFGTSAIRQMLFSWRFKYYKATSLLSYRPLYTYDESFERSMQFYKRYAK